MNLMPKESRIFTDSEAKLLEVFVTSATDPVYAVKHTVPPEVFGAFGSYFSRNPQDLREHLLNAIHGTLDGGDGTFVDADTGEKINSGMGIPEALKKTLDPAVMLRAGLSKSRDFYRRWYGKSGHKSTANVVWIPMVATNVSQLVAKELAYDQLAFFIEQSTRYVHWDADKMNLDPDIMASTHRERFQGALEVMIKSYDELTELGVDFYQERNPFNDWLAKQPPSVQEKGERVQRNAYGMQIRGAALDVSRALLPQAMKTNIAWIWDARSTEFDIAAWKGHPIAELRTTAGMIEKHAGQIAPSLLKYTEENNYYAEKLRGYDGLFRVSPASPFEKGADIISFNPDSLNHTIAHLLKRHNFGGTFRQRLYEAETMTFNEKVALLSRITENRGSHDEWVEMDEEFDLVKATAEIRTDIGAIRDLRRHQKFDRSEPLYTTESGFYMPPAIGEMSPRAREIFERAVHIADETQRKIKCDLPYQSQYIAPMATMHSLIISGGLDLLQYMLWTRSTPEGNPSYRKDAFNVAEAFAQTHPWVLGYETYPKEKPFMQIYHEAPLKTLLRLRTGETALHT
jgi:thymidylate synthase ThyX